MYVLITKYRSDFHKILKILQVFWDNYTNSGLVLPALKENMAKIQEWLKVEER